MKPAAIGIGAAVSRSTIRESCRPDRCNHSAHSAATANSAKNTALTVTPPSWGIELLNGTPKFDTYHQPLVEAKHSASTKNTSDRKAMRLRAERSTSGETSTVASAAMAAPTAANSPKWWIHLVGVNIRKKIVAKMTPISRQAGPRATPGTRLRRNMMNSDANSDIAVNRNATRREIAPSVVGRIR